MAKKKRKKHTTKKPKKPTQVKHKTSKFKKTMISLGAILLVLCVAVDLWWFYIYRFGSDKIVSNTYLVGMQELADGSESTAFAQVNYYTNENRNGLEMFELKLNYFMDESQSALYSQGLQYVADDVNHSIDWDLAVDEKSEINRGSKNNAWIFSNSYWSEHGFIEDGDNTSRYNYGSANNFETSMISSNPLDLESTFKITLGDDMYLMRFKNVEFQPDFKKEDGSYNYAKFIHNETNLWDSYVNIIGAFGNDTMNSYSVFNADYLAYTLYNSIQSVQDGYNGYITFEFGNIFDYFKYNSDTQQYSDTAVTGDSRDKVINDVKSYLSIQVKISENGAKNAQTDSLFKTIHGSQNYIIVGSIDSDYFIGRDVINVTLSDCEFVKTSEPIQVWTLKLKDSFVAKYLPYKDVIVLDVLIDEVSLMDSDVLIDGFEDGTFDDFEVWRCRKTKEIDGTIQYVDVPSIGGW